MVSWPDAGPREKLRGTWEEHFISFSIIGLLGLKDFKFLDEEKIM